MFTRNHVRARKPHVCEMCDRTIQPGETYMRGAGFGDGTAYTWKECGHCDRLVRAISRRFYDDTYGQEDLQQWEPETIAEARVRAQWKRRWTNRAGRLYPLPEIEMHTDPHGFSWGRSINPGEAAA